MPARAVGPQSAARPLSLAALSESWLASFVSRNTRDAYGRDLLGFVEWCAEHRISPMGSGVETFERYRDDCLRMQASPATVSRRLAALSSFYAYAARLLRTGGSNPLESVTRPAPDGGTQRTLTPAEVERLHAAAGATAPKAAVLVGLLLWEGLTLGAALALDVTSLSPSGGSLRATLDRRDGATTADFDTRTAAAIADHLAGRTAGPLLTSGHFMQQPGTRLTRFGADFLVKQSAQAARLEGSVSCATLRRTHLANRWDKTGP